MLVGSSMKSQVSSPLRWSPMTVSRWISSRSIESVRRLSVLGVNVESVTLVPGSPLSFVTAS